MPANPPRTVIATDLWTDNTIAAAAELSPGGGKLIPAYIDLLDAVEVGDLVATHRPDAIIRLAAVISPPSYRNPSLARRVNVGGTENLVAAAAQLPDPPLFLMASSAAVYGSRNPYRHPERIARETPVQPIDQYGEDKVLAEAAIRASGLPYALFRLGGVISPDTQASISGDHLLLMRSLPGDNRGWSFTGWFDTTEAQALLDFQEHDWRETTAWIAESQGRIRIALCALGPILRPALRTLLKLQRRAEGRGARSAAIGMPIRGGRRPRSRAALGHSCTCRR
jgi:NAD dependent epimerase/dehydratase family